LACFGRFEILTQKECAGLAPEGTGSTTRSPRAGDWRGAAAGARRAISPGAARRPASGARSLTTSAITEGGSAATRRVVGRDGNCRHRGARWGGAGRLGGWSRVRTPLGRVARRRRWRSEGTRSRGPRTRIPLRGIRARQWFVARLARFLGGTSQERFTQANRGDPACNLGHGSEGRERARPSISNHTPTRPNRHVCQTRRGSGLDPESASRDAFAR
jgi:hypothetical protein